MKLRTPIIKERELNIKLDDGRWKNFEVELITPMFGGGVTAGEPDKDMPVRAAAIRGQLRYWWRFLHRNQYEGQQLFKEERKIWGGMSEDREDHSSKVRVKLEHVRELSIDEYNEVADYALFPARGTQEEPQAKNLVREGLSFTLKIYCLNQVDFTKDVLPALRWWTTFGGLGARTRRGVGSVRINKLEPVTKKEAEVAKCTLIIRSSEKSSAMQAWQVAIRYLKEFRQGADVGRNHKRNTAGDLLYYDRNQQNPELGRSYWPEPDSIREIADTHASSSNGRRCNTHTPNHKARISFPRAAFGLPIIFKFKSADERCGDPGQTELSPADAERFASPLILTAYPVGGGEYAPAALLMPHDNLYSIKLHLSRDGNQLTVPSGKEEDWEENNWDMWPESWWDISRAKDVLPIKDRGTDALSAFMHFFEYGGE